MLCVGGMSHFSNHWGMVCDNVKNFEVGASISTVDRFTFKALFLFEAQVVLANSTVVHANADENPDLFRALKGGGPNFGRYHSCLTDHAS